jgi:hypothetical protein
MRVEGISKRAAPLIPFSLAFPSECGVGHGKGPLQAPLSARRKKLVLAIRRPERCGMAKSALAESQCFNFATTLHSLWLLH